MTQSKSLVPKLGIKPDSKVCFIHPNLDTLSQIRQEADGIKISINYPEPECDVILYWPELDEGIQETMQILQEKIKVDGRIWVIIPKKESAKRKELDIDWDEMQSEILNTRLVDTKVASINDEEYGTQFVIRQEYRR